MNRDWTAKAACAGLNTELFFSDNRDDQRAAKAICDRCPVKQACWEDALTSSPHGIRGGTTARQRRRSTPSAKKPRLAKAQRDEAIDTTRILTNQGISSRQIAARLGVDKRTILRWRHEYREAA